MMGGRAYHHRDLMAAVLKAVNVQPGATAVIQGGHRLADQLCGALGILAARRRVHLTK